MQWHHRTSFHSTAIRSDQKSVAATMSVTNFFSAKKSGDKRKASEFTSITHMNDGSIITVTQDGVYAGEKLLKKLDGGPLKSLDATGERIIVNGQVVVRSHTPLQRTSNPEQQTRAPSGILPQPMPNTDDDEMLARMLQEEMQAEMANAMQQALPAKATMAAAANRYTSALQAAGSVHIGDVIVHAATPPAKVARTSSTTTRVDKPAKVPKGPPKRPRKDVWTAQKLVEPHDKKDECAICMIHKRDVAFQPCGHILVCIDCANKSQKIARQEKKPALCPECRAETKKFVHVFV